MKTLNLPPYEFKLSSDKMSIFDVIRKKFIVLQPEEWVRQHFVNYLINHLGYPAGLIKVEFGGDIPGQVFVNQLTLRYPDMLIIFGIPLYGLLGGILAVVLLAYFGGKIYKIDLNIVYGRVLKKLDEIIEDMEELRS